MRALLAALLTAATLVSSSSATSLAFQCSTSQRMSAARWRGGRCCSAATKASRMLWRMAVSSNGSASRGSARLSAIGSSQCVRSRVSSVACSNGVAGPSSIGRMRREPSASASRQTFVAIR